MLLFYINENCYHDKNEMGGAWGREEGCTGFWWGDLRERDHQGGPDADGDNIKMDLQEVGEGCEDWMELAQDRDRWRALLSTVMELRISKCVELLDQLQNQIASQGLCGME